MQQQSSQGQIRQNSGQNNQTMKMDLLKADPALFDKMDPSDPFSLQGYDMLSVSGGFPMSTFSPISTSPLDPLDFETTADEATPGASGSLPASPFGTPGLHQYYSLSVPVRGRAGFEPINYYPNVTSINPTFASSYHPANLPTNSKEADKQ
jgi:hypothetical protein